MKRHAGVCAGCSTGCSIHVEENQERIYRLKPRENPHVNQWWMCDEGRYGYKYVHSDDRLTQPTIRQKGVARGVEWDEVYATLGRQLEQAGHVGVVVSPFLTVEEAYLLCQLARQIDARALLAVGPIPSVGHDESFPSGFTIRAEKCPNRRGVEAVVSRMGGQLLRFDQFLGQLDDAGLDALWVTAGYPQPWIDQPTAEQLARVPLLILQDLFSSPLWELATFALPGAAFAERAGAYVNCQDRLQSFDWAIRPPAGAMIEAHVYWRLLRRSGLCQAPLVLREVAREIGYFSAAIGQVPEVGIDLKVNQLAAEQVGATA
jgi:NADH-quinone oxidoreductase subunit G